MVLPVSSIAAVFINTSRACRVPCLPIVVTIVQHSGSCISRSISNDCYDDGCFPSWCLLSSSVLCLPSCICHLMPSVFRLLFSVFSLLSPISRLSLLNCCISSLVGVICFLIGVFRYFNWSFASLVGVFCSFL